MRVDPVRHIASEGSVSIIDLEDGVVIRELVTGRHASALAVSPNGRYVVCANAGEDTLTVIDARRDDMVETIWTRPKPSDLFGASPNALAFDRRLPRRSSNSSRPPCDIEAWTPDPVLDPLRHRSSASRSAKNQLRKGRLAWRSATPRCGSGCDIVPIREKPTPQRTLGLAIRDPALRIRL